MPARPLRIVLISEHASPLTPPGPAGSGGQNVYVAQVAAGLARRGHQVDVLTRRDRAELPAVLPMGPGVQLFHLDAGPPAFVPKERQLPFVGEFQRQARQWMRRLGPCDLLHAHFFLSGLVGQHLQQCLGLPLVVSFHSLAAVRRQYLTGVDSSPPERLTIERYVAHSSDCVIAESPQVRRDLVRHYQLPEQRIVEVPCGVDLHEFRPGDMLHAREQLGLPLQDFIVLQLGRLEPRKGMDNVIRGLALLPRDVQQRQPRLLILDGDADASDQRLTPEAGRLRRLVRALGLQDRVHFIGCRDRSQLARYYQAADVFVSTPWYEPSGITLLESMACATPVIGSAVGGILHTVVDGVTGYLVPPKNALALAEHLDWLRDHPQQAAAMGRAGLARVRRMFTWDLAAARLEAVYRRLLAERRWALETCRRGPGTGSWGADAMPERTLDVVESAPAAAWGDRR